MVKKTFSKINKLLMTSLLFMTSVSSVSTNVLAEEMYEEPIVTKTDNGTSIDDIDFSTGRLLVSEEKVNVDEQPVIAVLDGMALLQYETEEDVKEAYIELSQEANVEVDASFGVAEEVETEVEETTEATTTETEDVSTETTPVVEVMTEESNPFSEVEKSEVDEIQYDIAVIDTGATKAEKVVSVLGDDGEDKHGHGQKMIDTIKTINPNAKVLSIKALDDKGVGSVSAVYAGIELAIQENVKLINLSISAKKVADSYVIEEIINKAVAQGIKVVGAAGNNNMDAVEFIPGSIDSAIVMGASDTEGNPQPNSNYGNTVDYYMPAESTSIASAKASAYLSMGKDLAEAIKEEVSANNQAESTTPNENGEFETQETGSSYSVIPSGTFGYGVGGDVQGTVFVWHDDLDNIQNHSFDRGDINDANIDNLIVNLWGPKISANIASTHGVASVRPLGNHEYGAATELQQNIDRFREATKQALHDALDRRDQLVQNNEPEFSGNKARVVAVGITYSYNQNGGNPYWFLDMPYNAPIPQYYGFKDVIARQGLTNVNDPSNPELKNFTFNNVARDWNAVPQSMTGTKVPFAQYVYQEALNKNTQTFNKSSHKGVFVIAVLEREPAAPSGVRIKVNKVDEYGKQLRGANIVLYRDLDGDGFPVHGKDIIKSQFTTTGTESSSDIDGTLEDFERNNYFGEWKVREHFVPGFGTGLYPTADYTTPFVKAKEKTIAITRNDIPVDGSIKEFTVTMNNFRLVFRKTWLEDRPESNETFNFGLYSGDIYSSTGKTPETITEAEINNWRNGKTAIDTWNASIGSPDHFIQNRCNSSNGACAINEDQTYTIIETSSPDRWKKMSPITIVATQDANRLIKAGGTTVKNSDGKINLIVGTNKPDDKPVQIKKVDANGNPLANAELTLWQDKNNNGTYEPTLGEGVLAWNTSDTPVLDKKLKKGSYIVSETKVPTGYVKAQDKKFTITGTETGVTTVEIKNFQIKAQKIDGSGTAVKGATLAVYPTNSNTAVDTWTDSQNEHVINGLVEGEKYVLRETVTPAGYVKADDIPFTADNGTSTQVIKMTDLRIPVIKHDDKGQALAGVVLQVLEGNTVKDEWTTTKNEHYVSNLEIGKTYTLHEKSAPEEWELADDITFKADKDQSLVVLKMTDEHKMNAMLKKSDADLGTLLQGDATLVGTEFTLTDTTTNKEVGKMTVDSEGKTNVLENLTSEHNYKVSETKVMEGYKKANDITITGSQLKSGRDANYLYTFNVKDNIIRGGVKIEKWDKELARKVAQGNADFSGIKFEITNKSKNSVFINGKEYKVNEVVYTMTTNASGDASTPNNLLPYGTYAIKEVATNNKYLLTDGSTQTFQIREDGKVVSANTQGNAIKFSNIPVRGGVDIYKNDTDLKARKAEGDASFEGIQYAIVNRSKSVVKVNNVEYAPNKIVMILTLDKNGHATTDNKAFPYGTYDVIELSLNHTAKVGDTYADSMNNKSIYANDKGYLYNAQTKELVVDTDAKKYSFDFTDTVAKGSFKMKKNDQDLQTNYGQGDATDLTATYTITNRSKQSVVVNGKEYGVGEVVLTFKTNKNGEYTSATKLLPYGTYDLDETVPPAHYLPTGKTHVQFTIREDGEVKDLTTEIKNPVARMTVKVQKRDLESGQASPLGAATLEGAKFEVYNASKHDIVYKGKRIAVNNLVDTIVTDKNGVATINNVPYGTYFVKEVEAPNGYLLEGNLETTVVAHGEDKDTIFSNEYRGDSDDDINKSIDNQVKRGDVDLRKIISDSQRTLANVEFDLISQTTGETHRFMVDENGYFSTENSWNKHDYDTNGGKPESGTWFGQFKEDGTLKMGMTTVNNELRALPFDRYTLKEIEGENNKGYDMLEVEFTITRDDVTVHMNNLENTKIEIGTVAKSLDGEKTVPAVKDAIIVDTVTIKGAKSLVGKKAMLRAELRDVETKKVITTAELEFDVKKTDFSKDVELEVDGTKLQGKKVVVYEYLFELDEKGGETLKASHEDPTDTDQIVTFPKVSTTASTEEEKIEHTGTQTDTVVVYDDVKYEGLRKGKTYEVEGILMDKETEEPYLDANGNKVTASTKFKAQAPEGTVRLTFKFEGIVTGKTLVAFETLYKNGEEFAIHADINDEDQTLYYPEIKTRAKGVNDTKFVVAGKDCKIVDVIDYTDVEPNKTYVAVGTLFDKTTGKLTDITSESEPFVPETSEGSVEVEFNFDGTDYANHIMVVYEKLYKVETPEKPEDKPTLPEKPIATHENPEDEDQTIYVETPEDEKYVNKNVHQDLGSFKEDFTYDIMGYVTHDADTVVFSDELVEALEFVSKPEDVKVYAHATNDHKPNGTVASAGTPLSEDAKSEEVEYVYTVVTQQQLLSMVDANIAVVSGSVTDEETGETIDSGSRVEITSSLADKIRELGLSIETKWNTLDAPTEFVVELDKDTYEEQLAALNAHIAENLNSEYAPFELTAQTGKKEVSNSKYSVVIDGQNLTVEIPNVEEYRGKWLRVEFDAKIKDAYKSLEALKQLEITENGNVLTEEVHTGVPNKALMTIKVHNEPKYEIDTNIVTVVPPTPEIKTTLVAENLKTIYRGGIYEMVDTVTYTNLEVGETYLMKGKLVNAEGNAILNDGEEVTAELEFVPETRDGSVELTFTVDTAQVTDEHIVAFEKLYVRGDVVTETEPEEPTFPDNPEAPEVEISKTDATTTAELAGAKLVVKDAEGNIVASWVSTNTPTKIRLEAGEYTLTEITAPRGYEVAETIAFTVDENGLVGSEKVVMVDAPSENPSTPTKDTPVASHEDPKDPNQTVTLIEPNEPKVEKYINKAVHKDVTLDEIFTYDIVAFVPENADEIELTDVLNNDLQFVSKAENITLVDLGTDNNHKVLNNIHNVLVNEDATVGMSGILVDAEATIEDHTLTIKANAETLRGHWVKATFDAKIKDGKKVSDLQYTEIIDNDPVLTNEGHFGIPNFASLTVKVGNRWSDEYKSNTVTITPITIKTIAKFDNGNKSIEAGKSNKVIDTILYNGLSPKKKYVTYAQMMSKDGKAVSEKIRVEFTVESRTGEVKVEIPFVTEKLNGKYVAFEELYELVAKDGKLEERFVIEHKDLSDEDQTVTITTSTPTIPRIEKFIPTNTNDPTSVIGLSLGSGASLAVIGYGILEMLKRRKKK